MRLPKRTLVLLLIFVLSIVALVIDRASVHPARGQKGIGPEYSQREITHRFVNLYWGQNNAHQKTKWMGIKIQQTPTDMWSLQEIIFEIKPDFIVEAGTYRGGSALYFATLLHAINPGGRIITVDIEDLAERARQHPLFQRYVVPLIGSSIDDAVLSEVRRLVSGKRVLVFLDSDHHADHVYKEMSAYAEFVSVGSYMIVNDTMFREHPMSDDFGPGPLDAVEKFLGSRNDFKNDRHRSRFLLSFYPDGYLQRVK